MVEVVYDVSVLDKYLPPAQRFDYPDYLAGRSMVVKKAERLDLEWIIRGYITGSAWDEYRKSGTVSGKPMPQGLRESEAFPEPLFTPTTKASEGHDMPMSLEEAAGMVGSALLDEMKEKSLAVFNYARKHALERGFIIADTKMEFGLAEGNLILIDEILTPDSSRFWDTGLYKVGQPSRATTSSRCATTSRQRLE